MTNIRHEVTSRLFKLELNATKVKNIPGHKTYSMLTRYTHMNVMREVASMTVNPL